MSRPRGVFMPVAPPAGASRFCPLRRVVGFVVGVVGRRGIRHTLAKRRAEPVLVRKGEIQVPRPAGVQRLENLLAAIHPAHFPPLKFRCLLAHALFPRFWLRQFKATPPRLPHGQSSLLFHAFRAALQVHFWKFIYIFQKSAVLALAKPFFIRYNRAYALCVKKYEGRSGNSYAA